MADLAGMPTREFLRYRWQLRVRVTLPVWLWIVLFWATCAAIGYVAGRAGL